MGIAQWLEGQICDRKVLCLSPGRSSGRIFFFHADSYFGIRSTPMLLQ